MLLTVKDLELSNTFSSKSPRQAIAGMMGKGKKANVGRTWAFLWRIMTNQALICRAFFSFFPFLTSPKHSLPCECFLLSTFVLLLSFSDVSKAGLAAAKVSPSIQAVSLWVVPLPSCLQLHLLNLEGGEVKRMVSGLQKSKCLLRWQCLLTQ